MYQKIDVEHLPIIKSKQDVQAYNFCPDIVWIFDLDKHGFWWGNDKAIKFWGLSNVQQLIDKDLSEDTDGARKRTEQTFVKAALEGQTVDPWTTYPNGEPKLMLMKHVAVLLGEDKHRGIIAFMSEQAEANAQPENLLFAEAVRYMSVIVSCYNLDGGRLFENPAFTETYGSDKVTISNELTDFERRFEDINAAKDFWLLAQTQNSCQQEHFMTTTHGIKRHTVDIRKSRHPITGDYVLLVSEYDVTELRNTIQALTETKEQLSHLALYDQLTGLPNVVLSREHINQSIISAQRAKRRVAIFFIDLDGFKQVNDTFGHGMGDKLLQEVAHRLRQIFRKSDIVGRIGGDEFIACLPTIYQQKDVIKLAEKAIQKIAEPYILKDSAEQSQSITISCSIGLSFYPDDNKTINDLIRIADERMYQAKRQGKNCFIHE